VTARVAARLPRPVRALAVTHPFPTSLNAALVGVLVTVAGGEAPAAIVLGAAMLGIQASIGAVNDLVDEPLDRRSKPWKPLPKGLLSRRTALAIGLISGATGMLLSASFGAAVLALGAIMYACGLVYDLYLKPTALAPLCFAAAFPLLPVYAWMAAAASLPPRAELLLPVAALAGPTLQLANGLVDLESDAIAGLRGPVVRLGRRRSVVVLAALVAAIHGMAWLTLVAGEGPPAGSLVAAAVATLFAIVGVAGSAQARPGLRERGWQAQATAIVVLGGAWLLAASS
jgi:geranylgeranylglycerol-phosphate geranylgeranyltransferase